MSVQAPPSPPSARQLCTAVLRPATLWAAAAPVAVGTCLCVAAGRAHAGASLAAAAGAVAIQVGTNLFNDIADASRGADGPSRVGPPRAVARGWLSARAAGWGVGGAYALASACGLYLIVRGGWPVAAIGLSGMLCGLAYTGGPYPLGYHGLGELFVWIFFGPVAVMGTVWVQAGVLLPAALPPSVGIGSLAAAILVANNLRDAAGDALVGKRTLAVRWGQRAARWQYAACLALAAAMPLWSWRRGDGAAMMAAWAAAPWAWVAWRRIAGHQGAALGPALGATARLEAAYAAFMSLGLLLAGRC